MNSKRAKRLRHEAKAQADKEKIPDTGYVAAVKKKQYEIPVRVDENGKLVKEKVEVPRETLHVHPGTKKGIYKKFKKENK